MSDLSALHDMTLFVEVARARNFSAAGRRSEGARHEAYDVLRRIPSPGLDAERRLPGIHRISSSAA